MRVSEIMLATRVQIRPGDTIRRAVELLQASRLNGVPVVDDQGKLIGYFSKSHLYECLLKGIDINAPIEPYYIREVVSACEDTSYDSLEALSKWLQSCRVGQTIVVNRDNEPIGVATQAGTVLELLDRTDYLFRELSGVVENVPAGILTTSNTGLVTMANHYAQDILGGIETGRYIGDYLRELERDFSPVSSGDWMLPRKIEHNALKLIATAVPIYQHTRNKGAIFVIQDMTAVEGVAHELETVKELKMTLETVLEVAYEGVAVVDEGGIITLANGRFCNKVGEGKERVIGTKIDRFIPVAPDRPPIGVLEVNGTPCVVSTLPITQGGNVKGSVVKIYEDLDQLTDLVQQINRINIQLNYYKDELYKVNGTSYTVGSIVCRDERLATLKSQVLQVGRSNSTVLITGESGTGKELFAHSIHNASNRRKEPFVKVNCSAIPAELAEAELFGYEDGAFTGARRQGKPGKFELADGGTIFLDEIGDMPLVLQSKLLRVIQDKEIERVGGVKSRKVDVRIIAATNRDLKRMVAEGTFREDLYFRINVVELKIPPLRDRRKDIPLLADTFIKKYNNLLTRRVEGLSDQALEALTRYYWPGNIRELENVVERMLNYRESGLIELQDLPEEIVGRPGKAAAKNTQTLAAMEMETIQAALAEAGGNKSKAARLLGISRSKLYEKLGADR
ncbi:sigma-54-dependent Fis family transcriptional regulator [Geotalea sp. SG265]|uniref:sigma-54-dependent Fis family transcriptional regulator n=1 Tax=Geotalea sp. SG265 TaxID=2922867 RepID=UPI001FAEF8E6|nr:sigma-54-dependent Fis family transcriptional regulator [Geotalea sp. SG265]